MDENISKITIRENPDGSKTKVITKKVNKKIKLKTKSSNLEVKTDKKVSKSSTNEVEKKGRIVTNSSNNKVEKQPVVTKKVSGSNNRKSKIVISKSQHSSKKSTDFAKSKDNSLNSNQFSKKENKFSNNSKEEKDINSNKQSNENFGKFNHHLEINKKKKDNEFLNIPKEIEIPDVISIKNLAMKLNLKAPQILRKLFNLGVINLTVNDSIDGESAQVVCHEMGCEAKIVSLYQQTQVELEEGNKKDYERRDPVVTIMGHVDHGKTTLLDCIRNARVAESEYGGITQHIGAYKVQTKKGGILFMDTPGHSAFSAMRARGALVTDLIILVVSAVDGVKPQTIEVITHAKKSKVPIIVVINKIDLETANPERVKTMLAEHEIVSEEWGGETIFHNISALKNQGISELLETIALQSDILELKGNPKIKANGYIIESKVEVGKGNTANIIIKNGLLKVGDAYLCGKSSGKVRAMFDENGKKVTKSGPATVVEIIGLSQLVPSGELFQVLSSEKEAKKVSERRLQLEKENKASNVKKVTLSNLFDTIKQSNIKDLNIIIKADTFGSTEAIKASLLTLKNEEVQVNIIHSGIGAISENDVNLASTSKAEIIGFRVRSNNKVKKIAESLKVKITSYNIIYDIIDQIKKLLTNMLAVEHDETFHGILEVKNIFKISGTGKVAGCEVSEGKVQRNCQIRVLRDERIIHTGEIISLKRFKDEVKEVIEGWECGISLKNYQDLKVGDKIEAFSLQEISKELKIDGEIE